MNKSICIICAIWVISLICSLKSYSQDHHAIDSLLTILKTAPDDTNKIYLLLTIGDEYEEDQPLIAIDYFKKALNVSEQINNLVFKANCYEYLGLVYNNSFAKYDSAKVYYLECLKIRKEVLGDKHPDYAISLSNLAMLYRDMSNYDVVESLLIEAMKIFKETLGEKHPNYANSLNNLAIFYGDIGNFSAVEPLYIEVMNVRKEVLGEKHPDYAISLNNLAILYNDMGNYVASEFFHIKAIKILKEVLGEKHSGYANSLSNLAKLYVDMGNYSIAEPLYFEAKNIYKEVLGEKHPDYARTINNLAGLYNDMGNYSAAVSLFLETMNIDKKVLGEKHPAYAQTISNLATVYDNMGNYTAAEPLYKEAKNIFKAVLGEKNPNYATAINNIAHLYSDMGNYLVAEPLYIEAKNIRKEVLGEKHPDYASSLANLANLYYKIGNYQAACTLYFEAKNIRKEVLGRKHPDNVRSLFNLAELYKTIKDYVSAKPFYLEYLEIINSAINQNFAFLSEKEKEMYFKTQAKYFANFYSFSLSYKINNPEITKTVFNNVVKNKGLLLKSSTSMRNAILNSNDTILINKFNQWISLKKEISKLYSIEISKRKKNPEELEQQVNTIEKDLVRGSQVFSDFEKLQNLNWESVKNSLKLNEAAIEFIHFSEGKNDDTTTYCALIITPKSKQPEMIKLFEEKQMLEILNSTKGNSFSQVNKLYSADTKDSLYKLIWQPMEKYLDGVKTVYYSPDGILHKISFAALGKGKSMNLCDNYNLQQVSSTGKVAMPENTLIDINHTACIIGGIDYTSDSSATSLWTYLPGTLSEAIAINIELLKNKITVNKFTGRDASETKFKSIYGKEGCNPEIMHIATHGFFYSDPELVEMEMKKNEILETSEIAFRGGNSGFGIWQFVKNKNPLMRSGLVLAGANNVWEQRFVGEGEDGVLTAQEVAQLDMSKTKLVVLSACETGLGDIKGSEGVYGLQRAFKMAGVKFIIMSLWQVSDKETQEFMVTFYIKLLKQKDIKLAFTDTQKEMRQKYDPYYWAAFVLIE